MSLVKDGPLAHADCGDDCESKEPRCPTCDQPITVREIQTDQVGTVRVIRLHVDEYDDVCPSSNKPYTGAL